MMRSCACTLSGACVEHLADDEVMCRHTELQSRIDSEIEQSKKEKNPDPVEEVDMAVEVSCTVLCTLCSISYCDDKLTISVSQENYKTIFEAAVTFLDSLDTYANFQNVV